MVALIRVWCSLANPVWSLGCGDGAFLVSRKDWSCTILSNLSSIRANQVVSRQIFQGQTWEVSTPVRRGYSNDVAMGVTEA